MSKLAYRDDKKLIYGCYLTDEDHKIVTQAVDKAAKSIGVTNNRKARLALIEMARFYNEKGTSE
ncbi:hypothetical protein [Vibrio sp. 10N.261.46.A3]|uniref:hypothetical protein n=1 Tax=Vibrio sp. 10N.261.46.A3 TaxID=3229658 RepID=UPI00354FC5C0